MEPAARGLRSDLIQSFIKELKRCSLVPTLDDVSKHVAMAPNISLDEREALFDRVVIG
jgi:hypothetical protein